MDRLGFFVGAKMEILHRYTNACLWSGDAETIKEAVENAVKDGADLDGADLDGANLDGVSLYGVSLYGANLDGANLDGASLYGANLTRANLDGASLYGANLYGANLTRANLTRANLYGASLYGANLDGANLDGANLDGASLAKILNIGPIGSRNAYLIAWLMEDGARRYSTGCQVQIEEGAFLARVQKIHGDNAHAKAYRAAVEFARALADGAGKA